MLHDDHMPGGFSTYSCEVSDEAQASFDQAIENAAGVEYSPIAVAIQKVAGTNYRFLCNAKDNAPKAENGGALVSIFQPLPGKGNATITDINRIS